MKSSLYKRRWNPESGSASQPLKTIYLVHGISEHSGRYQRLAEDLCTSGWTVGAHDHRGFGQSKGTRGRLAHNNVYIQGLTECFEEFATETGSRPVLLGHSMGGVIAANAVLLHQLPVSALVLSSPAFKPALNSTQYLQLKLLSTIAPNFVLERSLNPRRLTHDLKVAQAYTDDELVHGFVSAKLIQWIITAGQQCIDHASKLSVPTLLLATKADVVIDPQGIRDFANNAPSEKITERWFDDHFHEVFNEDRERREFTLKSLMTWLEANAPD
jgi:alpha-beta hydrolase superfamily lysophospholipase